MKKHFTNKQVRAARTAKQTFLAGLVYNLPEVQADYDRLIGEAGEAGRGQMAPSAVYHNELHAYGIPSTCSTSLTAPLTAEQKTNLETARTFYRAYGRIEMLATMRAAGLCQVGYYDEIARASEPRSAHTVIDDLEARKHLGAKQAAWLRRAVDGTKVRKHNGETPAQCIERIYTARQRRISTADYELLLAAI